MNTPTRDFLRRPEGVRRRSARQALAVIPDMAGLAVSPGEVVTLDANAVDSLANSRQGLQSWSPAPSPDELVIQKRGRRRKTIVWSPDVDARKRDSLFRNSLSSRDRTPVKSPTKSTITLRSTPRKRLMLGGDSSELRLPNTPEKQTKLSNEPRVILPIQSETNVYEKRSTNVATSIDELLKGMGNEQLVDIIMNLIAMQEKGLLSTDEPLRDVIFKQIFSTDLKPFEESLDSLRKTIFAEISLSGDELSYDRIADHLNAYQAALVSQGKIIVKSQRWTAVMEYVFSAWAITKKIKPRLNNNGYEDFCHNCFEALARFCITAIECGNFHTRKLEAYADRLENISADREELRSCIHLIKEKFLSRTDK